jgi:hypothetical protein
MMGCEQSYTAQTPRRSERHVADGERHVLQAPFSSLV